MVEFELQIFQGYMLGTVLTKWSSEKLENRLRLRTLTFTVLLVWVCVTLRLKLNLPAKGVSITTIVPYYSKATFKQMR